MCSEQHLFVDGVFDQHRLQEVGGDRQERKGEHAKERLAVRFGVSEKGGERLAPVFRG